ncbi:PQQ-dependent sugar dehydrogenase [Phycisphaerales bacterium AB-hyl4]|uniref:PQQ-dependent sugar dehydrogenase n=1 Tax=Natronomicrosphaera hydrolytica TaxID=3242702 RepID=A0ABV4U8S4_9BACT
MFLSITLGLVWTAGPSAGAQQVQRLWVENCASCHGDQGQGANARSLLRDEVMGAEHDLAFYKAIREGLPDDGMDAYDDVLSEEETWSLVVHIRELQERARREREPASRPNDDGYVETTHHRYRFERVVTEGIEIPWALAFLPDGRLLIAERPGTVRLHDDSGLSEPVEDTPEVVHAGQGGLLGVALHPEHEANGWIYLSYSHGQGDRMMTRVVRGRIEDHRWADQEVIFEAPEELYLPTRQHYGCRLVFDDEGYLFIAIGDRGRPDHAQERYRPNGKIHRLHDDGSVPSDNPFVDEHDAMASVWSYGHRNPQGMVFDHDAGELWSTEHGPRGGDELNLIERGGNYGWPRVSHGINYNNTPFQTPWSEHDYIDPVKHWTPSIAACGLALGHGEAFPEWQGDLFAGGLAGQVVERLRVRDGEIVERERILERMGRVRDVITAPDGSIYVALNDPHHVVRLAPAE